MVPGFFHKVFETLLHNQNQFASGGMLLMIIGAVGASLRRIPGNIWDWIVNQITLSMSIVDETEAFQWFKYWYQSQGHSKRSRRVDVFSAFRGNKEPRFSPAVGQHWFLYKGRPLFISFNRSDEKKQDSWSARRTESFVLRTWGRNQKYLRDLVAEMKKVYDYSRKNNSQLYVWKGSDGYWRDVEGFEPRPLSSVVLPDGQKERIVRDVEVFRDSKAWYKETGIPYHRGYLFYGPPGTGKTSLITGLAHHFSSDVHVLKLSEHTDASLFAGVCQCGANSFIIMEDIDCVVASRKEPEANEKKQKEAISFVTLSGLLNVLDGLQAPSGVMFFMTTNRLEVLDEALLRPGRIDVKEFIGPATLSQKSNLYRRFFPTASFEEATAFSGKQKAETMADFQEILMKKRDVVTVPMVEPENLDYLENKRDA